MKFRPGTIHVNQAIDLDQAFVNMYEMPDDSSSGISTSYTYTKNNFNDPNIKPKSYSVPTMTMKELC
jgi:hypothetical protein